jgi:hypothetical protein
MVTYNVVHAGGKIQFGGLREGLRRAGYHVWTVLRELNKYPNISLGWMGYT